MQDSSFSIKSGQVHHGYKLSVKLDVDHELIGEFETVTASRHDSTLEQIKEGDIAAYRDKGYADQRSWSHAKIEDFEHFGTSNLYSERCNKFYDG